jgi:hypothetical protein
MGEAAASSQEISHPPPVHPVCHAGMYVVCANPELLTMQQFMSHTTASDFA